MEWVQFEDCREISTKIFESTNVANSKRIIIGTTGKTESSGDPVNKDYFVKVSGLNE